MSTKLISCTKGIEGMSAEELVAFTARVSNPANQMNMETAPKLIAYLIKNKHWSPLEMSSATIEIVTSRGIAAQILRHKSFSFQEFCISGDSEIFFDLPRSKKLKRRSLYKKTIASLYDSWNKNEFSRNRIKSMKVRILDEKSGTISNANIKNVFFTGIKPVFEVTLENGKKIKSTKEHKFYSKESGFVSLEQAVGLSISGKTATMSKNAYLATNGELAYQNKDWLFKSKQRAIVKKTGLSGISKEAGVSCHTIRKWLKIHGIQFTKKEVSKYTTPWNKNKFGYTVCPRTEQQKEHMRKITPKGQKHHAYRGGSRAHRAAIANFFNGKRKEIFEKFNYACQICFCSFNGEKIDIHHIKGVAEHPELALEISNVVPVHKRCHIEHHKKSGHVVQWRSKSKGNTVIPRYSKVVKVEYIGEEKTFDLEIAHESHNYIANGIVVHNSQRYAEAQDVVYYEARRQDSKNRQNSVDDMGEEEKDWFKQAQCRVWDQSMTLYKEAIRRGIAKEQVRFLLPLNTQTKLYMSGTLRSWVHYVELRSGNGTQKEHRDIAIGCKKIFIENFPMIAEALNWTEEGVVDGN